MLNKTSAMATVLLLHLFAAPAMAGGGPVPIIDLIDAPVVTASSVNPDLTAVQNAILAGLIVKGWTGQVVHPGLVHGLLLLREHRAEVDISFDSKAYSIKYVSSEKLDYDAKKLLIHRNYNNWIVYLHRAIDAEMIRAKT